MAWPFIPSPWMDQFRSHLDRGARDHRHHPDRLAQHGSAKVSVCPKAVIAKPDSNVSKGEESCRSAARLPLLPFVADTNRPHRHAPKHGEASMFWQFEEVISANSGSGRCGSRRRASRPPKHVAGNMKTAVFIPSGARTRIQHWMMMTFSHIPVQLVRPHRKCSSRKTLRMQFRQIHALTRFMPPPPSVARRRRAALQPHWPLLPVVIRQSL